MAKKNFLQRAKHYLQTAYETDLTDEGIYAPSIPSMMRCQAERDRSLVKDVSSQSQSVPVEVEENLIFSGRDVLCKAITKKRLLNDAHQKKLLKQQDREDLKCGVAPPKNWKIVAIKKRTCCGPSCGAAWRGSKHWRVCRRGHLYLYPKCRKNISRAKEFVQHCKICK